MHPGVLIAKIIAAHGIKGFVKIRIFTEDSKSIFKYSPIFDKFLREYVLTFVGMYRSDIMIVSIKGVCDRSMAETLKGIELFVSRDSILKNDEVLLSDLVGFEVVDKSNSFIGHVVNILNFGAGDVLEIDNSKTYKALLSYNKNSICNVNIKQRIIVIDRDHLLEN